MKTRHSLTIATGAASALALIPVGQAAAADASQAKAGVPGQHASTRALLANLGTVPLDQLDAWATKLQTAAAAVPDDTVLTGASRAMAKKQLRVAVLTSQRLGTLEGLTATQQAKVDVIVSRLSAAAAGLRALLANTPPVTVVPTRTAVPVTVVPTSTTKAVSATDTARRACAGTRDASHQTRPAGARDRTWTGTRTGDRDRHRDGDRRFGGRHHR